MDDFSLIFSWFFHDFFMIFSWFFHDFLMIFSWFFNDFFGLMECTSYKNVLLAAAGSTFSLFFIFPSLGLVVPACVLIPAVTISLLFSRFFSWFFNDFSVGIFANFFDCFFQKYLEKQGFRVFFWKFSFSLFLMIF